MTTRFRRTRTDGETLFELTLDGGRVRLVATRQPDGPGDARVDASGEEFLRSREHWSAVAAALGPETLDALVAALSTPAPSTATSAPAPGLRRGGRLATAATVLFAAAGVVALLGLTWRGFQLTLDAVPRLRSEWSLRDRGVPVRGRVMGTSNLGLLARGGTGKGNTSTLRQYVGTLSFRWEQDGRTYEATEEIVETDLGNGDGALRARLATFSEGGEVALLCAPDASGLCHLDEGSKPASEPLALAASEALLGVAMMTLVPCLAAWALLRRRG